APTILELAGVEVPAEMQGESMLPLLTQRENAAWRKELLVEQLMDTQNYPKSEAVRTKDWKYIRYFARTENPEHAHLRIRNTLDDYYEFLAQPEQMAQKAVYEELFDLANDPEETVNLIAAPEHQARLAELKKSLNELIAARTCVGMDERVCYDTRPQHVILNQ
ncbi:MAG: DUF4976 domain-containing protein, partial [Faecalibacterium sp.]